MEKQGLGVDRMYRGDGHPPPPRPRSSSRTAGPGSRRAWSAATPSCIARTSVAELTADPALLAEPPDLLARERQM